MADTHLDPHVLSALREVMEDEYSILVDTFLADSEDRLRLLTEVVDATQILETAHSFKGSSSNMGATRLAALCHDLEERAKVQNLTGIETLIAEIAHEFEFIRPLYVEERQRSLSPNATVRRY